MDNFREFVRLPNSLRAVALLVFLAAGCAGPPHDGPEGGRGGPGGKGGPPPGAPPFLTGPMSVVLANHDGFAAQITIEATLPEGKSETFTGQLMGQGSKLLFQPHGEGRQGKQIREARVSFVYDVAEGRGYMLSEALQGYAPISGKGRFAVTGANPGGKTEKIDGHLCDHQQVTVTSGEGEPMVFQVAKATDLHGLPLQIIPPEGSMVHSIHLSKVRIAPPPPEVFQAPDGFTKYTSTEAMMSELRLRQQGSKRKPGPEGPEERPGEMRKPSSSY